MQRVWRDIDHEGLSSAVTGTLVATAASTIGRTKAAIFADFPGHE